MESAIVGDASRPMVTAGLAWGVKVVARCCVAGTSSNGVHLFSPEIDAGSDDEYRLYES